MKMLKSSNKSGIVVYYIIWLALRQVLNPLWIS